MAVYYNECAQEMLVYLITNSLNGRQYVGITTRGIRRRWADHIRMARTGSKTALHAAIRKHGEMSFRIESIASAITRDDLSALECALIRQYATKAPLGYNLTDGGDGVVGLDPEIVARTAERNRGRKHSAEALRLIGEASRGRVATPETRRAIGRARKGIPLSLEHRAKLSAAKAGKKLPPRSKEHSARISDGLRRAHARRKEALT